MKKLFTLLLALTLSLSAVLGLTACDGDNPLADNLTFEGKTAEQIYNATTSAIETYKDNFTCTTNFDVKANIVIPELMTDTGDGSDQSISLDMRLYSTTKANGNNIYVGSDLYMGEIMPGFSLGKMKQDITFVDDVAYVSADMEMDGYPLNYKIKQNITMAQLMTTYGIDEDEMYNPLYDFPKVSFENVAFKLDGENTYFELLLKGEEAQKYINDNVGQMLGTAVTFTYSDISYKFYLKNDGTFDYASINFSVNFTMAELMTCDYTYSGVIRFADIGTTVVNAPADADEYVDNAFIPTTPDI